jgi:hypothetical protein
VEIKVAAMKGNVARSSVREVIGPAREVVRPTGKMIPSVEMTEVIWTR